MKERINDLIPKAIIAIKDAKIADNNNCVQKEFKGYVSSIGASIIQTGLLPTLAFYHNDSGKKAKSSWILKCILKIIAPNQNNTLLISYVIDSCKPQAQNSNNIRLGDLDKEKLSLIEEDIMDAVIAIKLALITYKIEGDE